MTKKLRVQAPSLPYMLVNVRPGTGERSRYIYAEIIDIEGRLCVAATLDYCHDWLRARALTSRDSA